MLNIPTKAGDVASHRLMRTVGLVLFAKEG
jgi:hypothetical protein